MHLLLLLALGFAAYAVLAVLLLAFGCRWQSVKPRAATAPPVPDSAVPTAPEEGTHA
jgi:hypothetical protein